MNYELRMARRIIATGSHKGSVSGVIVKISVAAIAIGLVMMIIAMATGFGLQRKIKEKVAAFNGHILLSSFDSNQSEISLSPLPPSPPWLAKVQKLPGVEHVQAFAALGGILRTEDSFEGIVLKGVDSTYRLAPFQEFLLEGKLPDFHGATSAELLISKLIANRLKLKVGDRVTAYFMKDQPRQIPNRRTFVISGIFDSNFEEFDATYIFGDIRHIQHMNGWKEAEVGGFEVLIDHFDQLDAMGERVSEVLPPTFETQTIAQKYRYIFDWVKLFDFNTALIIGIMILVAGINMITALLVLILDRTPMIGILKTMGSTNRSIRLIFLYDAAYLISLGLLIGTAVGLALVWIQDRFSLITLDPVTYYVRVAPVYIAPWHILLLDVGVLLLCLLMLLLPLLIIRRIQPVKAIRFN